MPRPTDRRCAAALLLVALLAGCAGVGTRLETPDIAVTSLRLAEAGLLEQRFDVRLRVTNPNPVPLPLEGLSSRLMVSGVEIGSGVARPDRQLEAYGETEVGVSLRTGTLAIAELLRRWREDPGEAIDYRIEGRVGLGMLAPDLSFSREGSVPLERTQ
jgi:LEA14-like dessication related protein